ncbi:lysozyme, partial [Escherichia coli MA6]
AVSNGKG